MDALFIGQTYIDVTVLADTIPSGDDKAVARDYAVSFGGNAVTAAFACAKLGVKPDLLASLANDWLGHMFSDMAARYDISLHPRPVKRSSLSFVIPNNGKRAILRARDDKYLHPFPGLNLDGCRLLHLDGHQPDAAIAYARACREKGILTSLDGGSVRANTQDLLGFIDVAVVAENFCEQMELTPAEMLTHLHAKGCRIGAVTLGERGMVWIDQKAEKRELPALPVPSSRIVDTSGAGDVFHGAYCYAWLTHPDGAWEDHFRFARGASAHAIQYLGNEAKLPTLADIAAARAEFETVA
ncbi:MAG: sugar kinase [Phreatobacter sp.]|nr:sugar kinase [Phreatobacter sp.]